MLFYSDNGPLLIAPRTPPSAWQGSGDVAGQDYDRACAIAEGAAFLPSGDAWVIVLDGELAGAVWLSPPPAAATAVVFGFDHWPKDTEPTAPEVREYYDELAQGEWTTLAEDVVLDGSGLTLLHAADMPTSVDESSADDPAFADGLHHVHIGEAVTKQVPAGRYRVEYREYVRRRTETSLGAFAVLVRFTITGGA